MTSPFRPQRGMNPCKAQSTFQPKLVYRVTTRNMRRLESTLECSKYKLQNTKSIYTIQRITKNIIYMNVHETSANFQWNGHYHVLTETPQLHLA